EVCPLTTVLSDGCDLDFLSKDDPIALSVLRHTTSHVLAEAVKTLIPEARLAIGPATDDGFYYDFDSPVPFTPELLAKIETIMKDIIRANTPVRRFTLSREEALSFMKDEPYKLELIHDLPPDAVISFYAQGNFADLCAGPHLASTGMIKSFRLLSVAGAYWRGSEKNKMLQRIYGTAFFEKEQMDAYLFQIEEAKKRDHRKLGRQLDLFDVLEEGPGMPFFYPKGMILRNELESYWRMLHRKNGYEEIKTPMILTRELWETSGHWDHYRDTMYSMKIDDHDYAVKPMNCPGGMLVYKRKPVSYKDLPIRCGELGLVHRNEKSGTLHGLMRVRCFTQDDAHIFMTEEMIKDEIMGVYRMIDEVYSVFGFSYHVELSTRPENSIGTDEMWETATNGLKNALDEIGINYTINEGDGAFYGPKIDFHLKDSLGRTWQCGTIQLDMNLPERFKLVYTDVNGEKRRPVMIHRVLFGSIERFIGILTEHYAGAFPVWLSPVQAKVLTITTHQNAYAEAVINALEANGIRTEGDLRNEKIGLKIREARNMKIPYLIVIGQKEAEDSLISVTARGGVNLGSMILNDFIARIREEILSKSN
ncbi:MAG: threonine--tRNA ligase, partial [Clostridia bacterium]|nr:threonine--tRNA ligase [Clostridia bacterium]